MSEFTSEGTGDAGEPNESYNSYSVDDEDQPQGDGDSLVDSRGLDEPLDEGYSPPEKWSPGQGYGNTPAEEEEGETLEQRLAQEEPEPDPYEQAANDTEDAGGEIGEGTVSKVDFPDMSLGAPAEGEMSASTFCAFSAARSFTVSSAALQRPAMSTRSFSSATPRVSPVVRSRTSLMSFDRRSTDSRMALT